MKLYLADNEKLNIFELPTKISESFLFSYTPDSTNIEVFLNIYSKDNKWFIKSNDEILINDSLEDIQLDLYKNYRVKIRDKEEEIYLYTYDNYLDDYKDIILDSLNTVTIGSKVTDSISYTTNTILPNQVKITYEDNNYYIENDKNAKTNLYINKKNIK